MKDVFYAHGHPKEICQESGSFFPNEGPSGQMAIQPSSPMNWKISRILMTAFP